MPASKPIYWTDVKKLFTGVDIAYMRMLDYPLDDYQFVKENRFALLDTIVNKTMPPKGFKPWTSDMIQTLKDWYSGGALKLDEKLLAEEWDFIALSKFLTGFDDLDEDPGLAHGYHLRLLEEVQEELFGEKLDQLIKDFATLPEADFESTTLQTYKLAAKSVILMWYTGGLFKSGFPAESPAPEAERGYQFTQGLVWRAILAHPMGYSTEGDVTAQGSGSLSGTSYWHYKPTEDGKFTGRGLTGK
jgi:hypothetical protein